MPEKMNGISSFKINPDLSKDNLQSQFLGTAIVNSVGGGTHVAAAFGTPKSSLDKDNKLVDYNLVASSDGIKALREKGTDLPAFGCALLAIRQRELILRRMNQSTHPKF